MPDDFFNSLYHLPLMSFVDSPLPNFVAIFEKETPPLIMLLIDSSTSAVHLMILPVLTASTLPYQIYGQTDVRTTEFLAVIDPR